MKKQDHIAIYRAEDGTSQLQVALQDNTIWLIQAQMASLFEKGRGTITEHINNVFTEGELKEELVCRDLRHTKWLDMRNRKCKIR